MTNEYLEQLRRSLIKQAKALEMQRDGVIQHLRIVEKVLGVHTDMRIVSVSASDSIAGIIEEKKGE